MNRATPAKDLAEAINQKLLHAYQFPRLHDGHRCALNEIAVVPAADQSVKLHVSIDGVPVSSEPVIGSGVLVATGAGSTGWNMAAGGSARHALSADLSLTFINAYSPRVPPMVVPFDSRITVTPHERNKRPARTRIDGVSQPRTHEQVFHIDLSGTPVEILYMPDHNFTRRMIAKVIR
jgi:NAD+ kinase